MSSISEYNELRFNFLLKKNISSVDKCSEYTISWGKIE